MVWYRSHNQVTIGGVNVTFPSLLKSTLKRAKVLFRQMIWWIPRSKGGIVIRKPFRLMLFILLLLTILVGCAKSNITPVPPTPTPFIGSARVELGDITMYFVAQGAGKPLILLHGGGSCSDAWFNQVPVFMKQYYVITPDNRGQGRTTNSDAPLSYHLMAEDTIRLMDYLGIEFSVYCWLEYWGNHRD